MASTSQAILRSLMEAPLLVGDLPEAAVLGREALELPDPIPSLNLQQKLGHLYEEAMAMLLEASPGFELVARGLQLRGDDLKTVGELDFLVRDPECDQLIHLELATKFYLAVETAGGLELPGPDARDNYFRKLHRLRSHQLGLSSNHRDCLPKGLRDESIVVRQLLYGCLFDHIDATSPSMPDWSDPECRRGHFPLGAVFQVIPKCLWPVPLEYLSEVDLEPWVLPGTINRCVMVRVDGGNVPYFVTPSGYPK